MGNSTKSSFADPAFCSNKSCPLHRWVPWIAGFSKEFVNDAISTYLNDSGTILDPFSGVGTTLVEAILSGNDAVGFEINPYAYFATKIKLNSVHVDCDEFRVEINNFSKYYDNCIVSGYKPFSQAPAGFVTRVDFYSPKVLKKVLIVVDYISSIENKDLADLFRLSFASTMVSYSNYSYEPSLGTRKGSGKENIYDFDVKNCILQKLNDFLSDLFWMKNFYPSSAYSCSKIIPDSFFNYEKYLEPNSVDLIITSPPYLNNYHYNRNTRPQIYWLGFALQSSDLKSLENANFGTYWQTVRSNDEISLNFELPNSNLSQTLDQLRSINKDKGIYGGFGWANYAATYFNDCYKFSKGIKYSLKQNSTALVVIGNSILQGIPIQTDQYFAEIAESVGLDLVDIHIPRSKRIGNSIIESHIRTKPKSSQKLYEAVVELKKI